MKTYKIKDVHGEYKVSQFDLYVLAAKGRMVSGTYREFNSYFLAKIEEFGLARDFDRALSFVLGRMRQGYEANMQYVQQNCRIAGDWAKIDVCDDWNWEKRQVK